MSNAGAARTICLPAVRALHDELGPVDAANAVSRLSGMESGFAIRRHDQDADEWLDELSGPSSWRLASNRHLVGFVQLGSMRMMGEGMLVLPPRTLSGEAVAAALVGRPVTDLLDHPLLDASMTITAAVPSDVVQCRVEVAGTAAVIREVLATLRRGERP